MDEIVSICPMCDVQAYYLGIASEAGYQLAEFRCNQCSMEYSELINIPTIYDH